MILKKENSPRIDLFIKKVCEGVIFTKSMKTRARLKLEKIILKFMCCLNETKKVDFDEYIVQNAVKRLIKQKK